MGSLQRVILIVLYDCSVPAVICHFINFCHLQMLASLIFFCMYYSVIAENGKWHLVPILWPCVPSRSFRFAPVVLVSEHRKGFFYSIKWHAYGHFQILILELISLLVAFPMLFIFPPLFIYLN